MSYRFFTFNFRQLLIVNCQLLNNGRVAEWLGEGLQNPLPRFNSGRDLIFRHLTLNNSQLTFVVNC